MNGTFTSNDLARAVLERRECTKGDGAYSFPRFLEDRMIWVTR
jgi:hypothetical protein